MAAEVPRSDKKAMPVPVELQVSTVLENPAANDASAMHALLSTLLDTDATLVRGPGGSLLGPEKTKLKNTFWRQNTVVFSFLFSQERA